MKKKYSVAIVGFGKLGILYSSLSKIHPDTNLKYIIEPNFFLRFFLKKRLNNVKVFKNIDQLIKYDSSVDIAFITTPNYSHFDISNKLAKAKIGIFVEKPLALNLKEVSKLGHIIKKNNIKLQVGYMFRYCKTYQRVKELILNKELGKIENFSCSMFSSQVFKKTNNWRFKKDKSGGGVLITQNTHLIDLLVWFFGMPKSILSFTNKIYSEQVEDEVSAKFYYNDYYGEMETSWSKKGYRNLTTKININFEFGSIEVNEDELKINPNSKADWTKKNKLNKVESFKPNFYDLAGDYYSNQFDDFIKFFKSQNTNNTNNILDSTKIHYIIDNIYLSSANKKEIKLYENFS